MQQTSRGCARAHICTGGSLPLLPPIHIATQPPPNPCAPSKRAGDLPQRLDAAAEETCQWMFHMRVLSRWPPLSPAPAISHHHPAATQPPTCSPNVRGICLNVSTPPGMHSASGCCTSVVVALADPPPALANPYPHPGTTQSPRVIKTCGGCPSTF